MQGAQIFHHVDGKLKKDGDEEEDVSEVGSPGEGEGDDDDAPPVPSFLPRKSLTPSDFACTPTPKKSRKPPRTEL